MKFSEQWVFDHVDDLVNQGFPTWAVGTPWGCRAQIQGVSDSFMGFFGGGEIGLPCRLSQFHKKIEIRCPSTFVADLNFDQLRWGVSDQLGLTDGVSVQNKVANCRGKDLGLHDVRPSTEKAWRLDLLAGTAIAEFVAEFLSTENLLKYRLVGYLNVRDSLLWSYHNWLVH